MAYYVAVVRSKSRRVVNAFHRENSGKPPPADAPTPIPKNEWDKTIEELRRTSPEPHYEVTWGGADSLEGFVSRDEEFADRRYDFLEDP
jgi:hypothetical protein